MINNKFFPYCFWKKILLNLQKPIIKNIYRGIIPKSIRNRFENFVDMKQQKNTAEKFHHFIEMYFSSNLNFFNIHLKRNDLVGKKIIWQYWGQGLDNCPDVVKVCFKSVDKFKGDYQVIRLNDKNIKEYLDIPDFIYQKKEENNAFKYAFFADLLRIALLDTYGGVWLDATILLTSEIPPHLLDMEFFMFHRDKNAKDKSKWIDYDSAYFNWDTKHKVNVLNSFIVSKRNNIVTHHLLNILMNFWKTQKIVPHYFFFQIMYNELINNQLKQERCETIDDTLPHLLHYNLNNPFNLKEYEGIIQRIGIHKLRYIKNIKPGSYADYIINHQFNE